MKINFKLNGENVTIDTDPQKRLVSILREDFRLTGTKAGCYRGECESCAVLFNGDIALSCQLPAFTLRNNTVVTIEGFEITKDYENIVKAFNEAGHMPCKYCFPGRVFHVYALLDRNPAPNDTEILEIFSWSGCGCSDSTSFIEAVKKAAMYKENFYDA